MALLSPCFWPEVRRGAERFARLLADGLIARGAEVTLITSHPGATARTVEDGLEIVRLRRPPGGGRLARRMLVLSPPRGDAPPLPPGARFADVDDTAALVAAYRAAWVTALPSIGEAFGLVLVESLACGTPVVASDEGGMREVVGDRPGIGRLFAGDDPDALAVALDDALALTPGAAAACRGRAEDFPAQDTADDYLDLYRELGASR